MPFLPETGQEAAMLIRMEQRMKRISEAIHGLDAAIAELKSAIGYPVRGNEDERD